MLWSCMWIYFNFVLSNKSFLALFLDDINQCNIINYKESCK